MMDRHGGVSRWQIAGEAQIAGDMYIAGGLEIAGEVRIDRGLQNAGVHKHHFSTQAGTKRALLTKKPDY